MALQAGRLRHRVAIEERIDTDDDNGGFVTTWQLLDAPGADRTPCEIAPLSGKEWIASAAAQTQVTGRVTLRAPAPIDHTMRLRDVVTGLIYNIVAVLPDAVSGLEYVTILTTQGTNDGGN